jgi:hypothetical protein
MLGCACCRCLFEFGSLFGTLRLKTRESCKTRPCLWSPTLQQGSNDSTTTTSLQPRLGLIINNVTLANQVRYILPHTELTNTKYHNKSFIEDWSPSRLNLTVVIEMAGTIEHWTVVVAGDGGLYEIQKILILLLLCTCIHVPPGLAGRHLAITQVEKNDNAVEYRHESNL